MRTDSLLTSLRRLLPTTKVDGFGTTGVGDDYGTFDRLAFGVPELWSNFVYGLLIIRRRSW
ncbi:MAG: hypothetical protein OXU63_00015, partial [Acidobacteriota bacterium]|nr:hypothetical protein [Acidobacteriota bacterium]